MILGGAEADAEHNKHSWARGPPHTASEDALGPQTPRGLASGLQAWGLRGPPEPRGKGPDTHTHLEAQRGFCCGIRGGAEVTAPRRPREFWTQRRPPSWLVPLKRSGTPGMGLEEGMRGAVEGTLSQLGVPAGLAQFRGGGGS